MKRELDAFFYSDLIRNKEISSKELIEECFKNIARENPVYNALVNTRKEKALREAGARDYSNKTFPGIPIVIKDLGQNLKGETVTSGSRLFKNNIAAQTNHFVQAVEDAGFIVIGQSNTPEFGFKNITDPVVHGPSRNPYNKAYSPGGSSGGSAAAVASDMVPIAAASDGGGSIRIPASFTGLVGLKPTRGRTPAGPESWRNWQGAAINFALTKSVRDTALMLDALKTFQPEAPFQTPLFAESYFEGIQKEADKKYKIAYSLQSPIGSSVSDEAKKAVLTMAAHLERMGHFVEEKTPEINGISLMESYYLMNGAETDAMFRGIAERIGRELTVKDMELTSWAMYQYGKTVSGADYSLALDKWDLAGEKMHYFHKKYDLLLQPATAESAPLIKKEFQDEALKGKMRHAEELAEQERKELIWQMFSESLAVTPFTQRENLTGQPAISLPTHLTKKGLPIGVQFTAAKGREDQLLKIAKAIESEGLFV